MELDLLGFKEYLLEQEFAENSIKTYISTLKKFQSFSDKFDKESILNFKHYSMEFCKPSTVNIRLIAINNYAEYIHHPELKVKTVKNYSNKNLENVISIKEYNYLTKRLKTSGRTKMYFMIKFLALTGCRVSELVRLTKDSLETGECVLWTKGKMRRIFIPEKLIKESEEYFSTVKSEYLFPNKNGGKMTTNNVYQQLMYYASIYNIRKSVMHPHSFRHLFAIQFLKNNGDITLLKDILGHEDLNTTSIYLRLSLDEQKTQFNNYVSWG